MQPLVTKENPLSYGRILRSSSIMGGAMGINYLLSMIRVKIIAVLLGPDGVGLLSLFTSAVSGVVTVAGLGINSSAVRSVALAKADGDGALARVATSLRFACRSTATLGFFAMAVLAYPLSLAMFKSSAYVVSLIVLGFAVSLTTISNGQAALLQGLQRIGDVARVNVIGVVAGTIVSIVLFYWLGKQGIVPVLILTAATTCATSWWYVRKANVASVAMQVREYLGCCRQFIVLGLGFLWTAVLFVALNLFTCTVITRRYGLESTGIYQAAWSLSGMFANFVLSAMGTDFYPRLTALIHDQERAIRYVNEQTEIGILLSLAGLVATVIFAPLIIQVFYTARFLPAAQMLPWFVLGIYCRILIWPVSFLLLAKAATWHFILTETVFNASMVLLILLLLPVFGIIAVSYAFIASYILYFIVVFVIARRLVGFSWSKTVARLFIHSLIFIALALAVHFFLPKTAAYLCGLIVTGMATYYCFSGLVMRLGRASRLAQAVVRIPGGQTLIRIICGGE